MSFTPAGVYTQVSGAVTAAAGQVIQSAVWNNTHGDLGNALTALGACEIAPMTYRNMMAPNGGFEVWQRGADGAASIGVNNSTGYTADRWYLTAGLTQASVVSQQTGLTVNSLYCARVQRTAGQTGVTGMIFAFPLDLDEVMRLRGRKVSLSFYAATGANWSPANGTLTATLYVGTGSVQKAGAAAANFTGPTTVIQLSNNIVAGTAATAYGGVSTATVPAAATQAELQFTWTPVGTAGANDWVELDDVMLDASAAPAQGFIVGFERISLESMLRFCKRHYWKTFAYGTAPAQSAGAGTGEIMGVAGKAGANPQYLFVRYPCQMRITNPAATLDNPAAANAQVRDETANADCSASSAAGITDTSLYVTATGNGGTAVGNLLGVHLTVDAGI